MTSISRKNILALAIAAALAPAAAFAQTTQDFTWYGRIDTALESNDDGTVSRTLVQNFASRLGIRGEKKVSGDLSAVFQVETGVAPDNTANSKTLASRNSFVGLKSQSMGTLIMGTHDMPFKTLEGTASQLWGSAEAMEPIIHGKATRAGLAGASFQNLHTRQTNVVLYTSPKFSDVVFKLAYSPDEVAGAPGTVSKPVYGASVEFNNGAWNAGLATETKENANTVAPAVGNMTGTKATLGMKMGDWSAGLAFSTLDNSLGKKTSNWLITGSYKMGALTFKGNYGASGESSSGADDALNMIGLEVDYSLDKAITLYTYYTAIDNGTKARGAFVNADDNFTPVAGKDPKALGFGIRYNF
ncbi:MAG: porin [Rhodoferax sp.]|nr:porin [Rhodoferax sp.]